MKQSKKKSPGAHSRSHVAKTQQEKDDYSEKVKLSDAEGETVAIPASGTSTLSERSVYAHTSSAGIPDRNPIKPPQDREPWYTSKVTLCVRVVAVAVPLVTAVMWLTTLGNRTQFNETRLTELNASLSELDSKREDLNTRIVKLEQWRDVFSDELKQLRLDMGSGLSNRDVEIKLSELEKRILSRLGQSQGGNGPPPH